MIIRCKSKVEFHCGGNISFALIQISTYVCLHLVAQRIRNKKIYVHWWKSLFIWIAYAKSASSTANDGVALYCILDKSIDHHHNFAHKYYGTGDSIKEYRRKYLKINKYQINSTKLKQMMSLDVHDVPAQNNAYTKHVHESRSTSFKSDSINTWRKTMTAASGQKQKKKQN